MQANRKKSIFKSIARMSRPATLLFLKIFFNKDVLRGRYFEDSLIGYRWAFRSIWQRNILRLAPPLPFPASLTCQISNGQSIVFHPDDLNNFQTGGTYYQNFAATITIGKGTYIAPNVGIITANHDPKDLDGHKPAAAVTIGENCWIGMNSMILPGVSLGERTIVGAGSVVTKPFLDGHCVVAGNPARIIKRLEV